MYIEFTPLGKTIGRTIWGLCKFLLIVTPFVLVIMLLFSAVRCADRAFSSNGRPPLPTATRPISQQIQFPPGPAPSPLPFVQNMLRYVAPGSTTPNPLEPRPPTAPRPAGGWSSKIPVPKGSYFWFEADRGDRMFVRTDKGILTWVKGANGVWVPEADEMRLGLFETSAVEFRSPESVQVHYRYWWSKNPPPGRWYLRNP